MKKTFSLTRLIKFAAIIAFAAMLFTGCENPSGGDSSGSPDSGYQGGQDEPGGQGGQGGIGGQEGQGGQGGIGGQGGQGGIGGQGGQDGQGGQGGQDGQGGQGGQDGQGSGNGKGQDGQGPGGQGQSNGNGPGGGVGQKSTRGSDSGMGGEGEGGGLRDFDKELGPDSQLKASSGKTGKPQLQKGIADEIPNVITPELDGKSLLPEDTVGTNSEVYRRMRSFGLDLAASRALERHISKMDAKSMKLWLNLSRIAEIYGDISVNKKYMHTTAETGIMRIKDIKSNKSRPTLHMFQDVSGSMDPEIVAYQVTMMVQSCKTCGIPDLAVHSWDSDCYYNGTYQVKDPDVLEQILGKGFNNGQLELKGHAGSSNITVPMAVAAKLLNDRKDVAVIVCGDGQWVTENTKADLKDVDARKRVLWLLDNESNPMDSFTEKYPSWKGIPVKYALPDDK